LSFDGSIDLRFKPDSELRRDRKSVTVRDSLQHDGNLRLGARSAFSLGLAPFGERGVRFSCDLDSPQRKQNGLVVILPGIEGRSSVNDSIALGVVASGLPHAVMIIDWRKSRPWNPFYLTMERHNRSQAREVARVLVGYLNSFPGRSVHLIGHSAGAGMALFVLQAMPEHLKVSTVILLAAAISRDFAVDELTGRTTRGIWNFYSPLDMPTVGLGTLMFGTMDRRHAFSAGALGFREKLKTQSLTESQPRLHQVRYRAAMIREWNFGGHFGATNAAFVRTHVSPLLR
jgi:pimeloyl-ACP methyl ester carboxylesterase